MTNTQSIDLKLLEALGTVFLSTIEEELVSMTYGLTRLLKQGLETQAQMAQTWTLASDRPTSEEAIAPLLDKLNVLLDSLQQHHQTVAALESRLSQLETTIAQPALPCTPTLTPVASEVRLNAIEDSPGSVELLAGELGHQNEDTAALHRRLDTLERMIDTMTRIPDSLGQQTQILTHLDDRLARLEAMQTNQPETAMREIAADRLA